ncbi:ABC transporter [uncultured Gammaproteobacteria bacterium]
MSEVIARLRRHPTATFQLLIASLVINLLGLASSLYVIQVLNRYVSYGVGGTLATLTIGVIIALAGEHGFRRLRLRLAETIVGDAEQRLATGVFGLLLTARADALAARPPGERIEVLRGLDRAEAALGASTLAGLADVPFSGLFLAALALLSPVLALIAAGFCLAAAADTWLVRRRLATPTAELATLAGRGGALVATAVATADTVRQFRAGGRLMARWQEIDTQVRDLRRTIARRQHDAASFTQAAQGLMGVAVIGVGALLVVNGALDVGALIGANLIAARALAPILRLVNTAEALIQAEQGLAAARRFAAIAVEPEGGRFLPGWNGRLTLDRVSFTPPGAGTPLFSDLSLTLEPGGVLVITGRNGTGKTSLLRLLAGLAESDRGEIRIEGVDLRQVSLGWWRRQVSYVPQEPVFADGPLGDTLRAVQPEAAEAGDIALWRCLERVGLKSWLDRQPQGLNLLLNDGGRTLAPGLRRRLALARALLIDGPLVLLDEPSEGLDREGAGMVYALLIDLVRRGRTLVVVSHDPVILRGAQLLLRLDGGAPVLSQNFGVSLPNP